MLRNQPRFLHESGFFYMVPEIFIHGFTDVLKKNFPYDDHKIWLDVIGGDMASDSVQQKFLSKPGEGQILVMSGARLKVSSAQTHGVFEVIEIGGPGSPLPHVHHDHDECFYIIEGIYTFTIASEEVEASADSLVFIPKGTPHAFKHSEGARALVFVIPANLEGFFRELGEGFAAGRSEKDLRNELAGIYDSWPVG